MAAAGLLVIDASARGTIEDGSTLRLIRADGSGGRLIARNIAYFKISPNGKQVAYLSSTATAGYSLWITDLLSGRARNLTGDLGSSAGGLSWSPSGDRIVFASHRTLNGVRSRHQHILVISATGTALRQIGRDGWAPVWSPDGRRIAYLQSDEGSVENRVIVVSPEGRELWRKAGTGPVSWSPAGSLLYRTGYSPAASRMVVASASGQVLWQVKACLGDWAPDGKTVVVSRYVEINCGQGPATLVRVGEQRVTVLPRSNPRIAWSADGRRIAWTDLGNARTSVGTPDGRVEKSFALKGHLRAWSPNGKSLLLSRPTGLWFVPIDGSVPRLLTRTEFPYPGGEFAGRSIVYDVYPP